MNHQDLYNRMVIQDWSPTISTLNYVSFDMAIPGDPGIAISKDTVQNIEMIAQYWK